MGTGQRLPRPLRTLDKGRREVRTWGQARGSADSRDHSPPCRAGWAHGCTCPSFLPPRHGGWRRPLLPVGNERLCRRHSPAVASPPPHPGLATSCRLCGLHSLAGMCAGRLQPTASCEAGSPGSQPGATRQPRRAVFPKTDTCCWFRSPPAGRQLGQQLGGRPARWTWPRVQALCGPGLRVSFRPPQACPSSRLRCRRPQLPSLRWARHGRPAVGAEVSPSAPSVRAQSLPSPEPPAHEPPAHVAG